MKIICQLLKIWLICTLSSVRKDGYKHLSFITWNINDLKTKLYLSVNVEFFSLDFKCQYSLLTFNQQNANENCIVNTVIGNTISNSVT